MDDKELETMRTGMQEAASALMMLRSEMSQREARMGASFNQQMGSLQQAVEQFRQDIAGIIGSASAQIAQEAKNAVAPVAAQYERAVSETSAQLRGANRTIQVWFCAAGAILLLVLAVGWAVLGYYRRELGATKAELQRYENAVPVVQAFHASDAILCEGRVCANVGSGSQRFGDERQYRQAKPRPQK